jgi:tetratricopeptide (TPR) repeat protein
MTEDEDLYESLMSSEGLSKLPVSECLVRSGQLVDLSMDLQRMEGLTRAVALLEELRGRELQPQQSATCQYFLANAWSNVGRLSKASTDRVWEWEQPELEKEIVHLRQAIQVDPASRLPDDLACHILTSLGNAMDHAGRFVEATEYWDKALQQAESFQMALGNRGIGLVRYASLLYDRHQAAILLSHAHGDLTEALSATLPNHTRDVFDDYRQGIEAQLPLDHRELHTLQQDEPVEAESDDERSYRLWGLANRLFLSPLNDLGPYPSAAEDVLAAPSIVVGISEGPYYPGFFNQMKQEFVSARYLYYDGVTAAGPHFSDRRVRLFNTLDYPVYCLAAEKTKAAFRMAYSLFDKIAYFLNHYLKLSVPEWKVSFRNLWYVDQKENAGLKPEFEASRNMALRGLFWLSKDLYEQAGNFRESLEPDARELSEVRNHLEHKYLKLHSGEWRGRRAGEDDMFLGLTDTLAYSLQRRDFEAKTLRLIKMARAALIHLSLAIHWEERRRAAGRSPDFIIPPMPLDLWDDGWKY